MLQHWRWGHGSVTNTRPLAVLDFQFARVWTLLQLVNLQVYMVCKAIASGTTSSITAHAHLCLLSCAEGGSVAPQLPLVDLQERLLGADDAAGAAHTDVGDGLLCREAVVLHDVAADEHACARCCG